MLTIEIDFSKTEAEAVRRALDVLSWEVNENATDNEPVDAIVLDALRGFKAASESYLGSACGRYRLSALAFGVIVKAVELNAADGDVPADLVDDTVTKADWLNLHSRLTHPATFKLV